MKQQDGLKEQLRQFFERNPTESLTMEDIEIKFGVTHDNVKATLSRLRKGGWVRTQIVVMSGSSR